MFKKITISVAALAAISTAQASDYYIQYNQTIQNAESKTIFGIQPLEEIVGNGGVRHAIAAGKMYEIVSIGGELGYTPKNKEYDVRANIKLKPSEPVWFNTLSPYFASSAGVFMQDRSDKLQLSTNANVLDYIISEAEAVPSSATFEKKPKGLILAVELGLDIQITKSISAFTAYEFSSKMTQFSYRLDSQQEVLNSLSINQRNNNLKLGLNYKF